MLIFDPQTFFVGAQFGFSQRNVGVLNVLGGVSFDSISPQSRRVRGGGAENFKSGITGFFISWRITQVKELALLGVAFYLRFTASANIAAGRAKEYRFRNPDLAAGVLGFVHEIQV